MSTDRDEAFDRADWALQKLIALHSDPHYGLFSWQDMRRKALAELQQALKELEDR